MLKTSVEPIEATAENAGEGVPGKLVKLTVTVSADEVDKTLDATYKKLAGKYRFPGFRPGKAPRPILEQQLGRDYILAEAAERVVSESYPQALDAEGLRPIESPEISEIDLVVPGEDYTYSAEVEVRPELELSDYDGFEVTLPSSEASQSEVDEYIESSRERFATLEPVEDRGVEVDDFVLISFTGTVDGEPYEGNEVDKYLYEMNRGLMPPQFDEGIVGAKPGDVRHVEFEIPDTSSNPEFVGKTAAFEITVHEVKAKKLPEIDEEFAANVGGFDSVEEMVADLKSRLDLQKGTAHARLKERRIREALALRLDGAVPDGLVIQRQSSMMRDFMGMLEARSVTIDQYLMSSGIDMDSLDADLRQQAEQSVREDLALEALARAKGIEVAEEDIQKELEAVAETLSISMDEARKRWKDMGLMSLVNEQIIQRKAYEWLLENITVVAEEESEAADGEQGTKKEPAENAKPTDDSVEPAQSSADEE